MHLFRLPSLRILCALCAFLLAGDILADALHEAIGVCATESQGGGEDSCPAGTCAIHNGTVVTPDIPLFGAPVIEMSGSVAAVDDSPAEGAPRGIDHPPQLS